MVVSVPLVDTRASAVTQNLEEEKNHSMMSSLCFALTWTIDVKLPSPSTLSNLPTNLPKK